MSVVSTSSTKLRILQHNCALSTNIMHSLLNAAATTADIIFVQEPWLSRDYLSTISHPTFKAIIPTSKTRPRVITFISTIIPTLEATPRPDIIDDPDCQVIDIKTANIQQVRVYNIYNESQQTTPPGPYTIERLIGNIRLSIIDRSLLVGDFNAHHYLWNLNCQSSIRAETLVNLIDS